MANELSLKDQLSSLPMLTGDENYPMWNKRMSAFLRHKELWAVVTEDPGPFPNARVKKLLSESANIILMKLGDKLYNSVVTDENDNHGFMIWTRIKDLFAKRTSLRLSRCLSQWHKLRYEGNLGDFLDQVELCLAAFDSITYVQESSAICGIIISKLSEERHPLTDTLNGSETLMNDHILLINRLRDIAFDEQCRRKKKSTVVEGATAMNSQGRPRNPFPCKDGKHNPKATSHPEERCWSLYPEKRRTRNLKNSASQHHTQAAEKTQTEATPVQSQHERPAFLSFTSALAFSSEGGHLAVLDSGASHHMFNDLAFLQDFANCSIPISTGRNSSDLTATKIGTALIFQSNGQIITLVDALFVPGLSRNLISMAKLSKDTIVITRKEDAISVLIDNSIHLECTLHNNVLELAHKIGPVPETITSLLTNAHSPQSPFDTWHTRLGHAGVARLRAVLPGVSLTNHNTCSSCVKGKISRSPFKGHFSKTSHSLEVIHADLVGPITPSTNSGARYFLTLVDQHTGFISATLLKRKSDSLAAILDFQRFFERQTGNKIKKLVTDGGGEFCNNTLASHLQSLGIQHNVSPPYTPQHNGVAERANKTIINMARCMLLHSNLAKEWWGEAVRTAVATTNCLPSLSKSRISPIEQLFGKAPNLNFFRPFGCRAWIIKPNQLRERKFDEIAWDGVLVGYSNDYSSYRIVKINPLTIVDTRHVYFDEASFPSLRAINPSPDMFPHTPLPNFSSAALLPFEEEDEESVNNNLSPEETNQSGTEDVSGSQESSEEEVSDVESVSGEDEDSSGSNEDVSGINNRPRRLVLRVGPHPTRVSSTVDTSNILAHRTRSAIAHLTTAAEPKNHSQAMSCDEAHQWQEAEAREIANMHAHQVWSIHPRQQHHHPIPSTWAYKKKLGPNNEVIEFKARICAQGFRQTFGLNFESKYAPTGKPSSLRLLISFAADHDLLIHQLDVKSAFLTCSLDEQVTMLPPPGHLSGQDVVLQLQKAIYGLKQSSLAWYKRLSTFLKSVGFSTSLADPCVFWRTDPSPLWIFAHVDDLIIFGKDPESFRTQMSKEFQIKYLGPATFLLGMTLDRISGGFVLHQSQYVDRKLAEFNATHLPPSSCPLDPRVHLSQASQSDQRQLRALGINYRALIGSLNYLSILTRPDISFAVSKLSQFLENPGLTHYKAAMQVFRFLKGTSSKGLKFVKQQDSALRAFVDADWANCPDTRRSHTGYMVFRNQHLVSWKSTKQTTVSLSSTEAEYKALADACKEVIWTQNLAREILAPELAASTMFVDNRGAIDLALSHVSQNSFRTKHMDLRLHFIRDLIKAKSVQLKFVGSQHNISDILTKPVGRSKINRSLGNVVHCPPSLSASRSTARSTSACQDEAQGAKLTADTVMQSICDEISTEQVSSGPDQTSATASGAK